MKGNDIMQYNNYELNDGVVDYLLSSDDKEVLDEGIWIVDNKTSIRKTSKEFYKSKSSVHRDVSVRLRDLSFELYMCVKRQLSDNKKKYFR